jgi:hypothetical protein
MGGGAVLMGVLIRVMRIAPAESDPTATASDRFVAARAQAARKLAAPLIRGGAVVAVVGGLAVLVAMLL